MHDFVKEFISGNAAGLCGILVVYPMDTAKIRMQTHQASVYRNMFHVFEGMVRTDGVRSLYRGILSPALGFGFTFAVTFSAYGQGCRTLAARTGKSVRELSPSQLAVAGAYAGLVQSPLRQIVERVKSVMQIQENLHGKSRYRWSGECFLDLLRSGRQSSSSSLSSGRILNGGLWQGMSSVLLREIPQFAVYYPTYAVSKSYYTQLFGPTNAFYAQLLAGGTAGFVQWLPPFYFLDIIKSRMQTSLPGTYTGIAHCVQVIYKEGGSAIFFRGLTPALIRAFTLHSIIFLVYEEVSKGLSFIS